MRRKAETVTFVPGGRWDERSVGTNALAIAWSLTERYIAHEIVHTHGLGHAQALGVGDLVRRFLGTLARNRRLAAFAAIAGACAFALWRGPLPEHLAALQVLANPWVMGAAGLAAFMEFFADKIAWLDSIWDGLNTLIRPLGGALLALVNSDALVHPGCLETLAEQFEQVAVDVEDEIDQRHGSRAGIERRHLTPGLRKSRRAAMPPFCRRCRAGVRRRAAPAGPCPRDRTPAPAWCRARA